VLSGAHMDLSARKGEKSLPKVAGEYPKVPEGKT
jgi:hypothetical protein